mmetsp:Transcript_21590/g.67416  ORF Transcript_21590/g.67416 Transcript_21590/m.67416 type:complete len:320 (-) Transcript_21590:266-1225(-)
MYVLLDVAPGHNGLAASDRRGDEEEDQSGPHGDAPAVHEVHACSVDDGAAKEASCGQQAQERDLHEADEDLVAGEEADLVHEGLVLFLQDVALQVGPIERHVLEDQEYVRQHDEAERGREGVPAPLPEPDRTVHQGASCEDQVARVPDERGHTSEHGRVHDAQHEGVRYGLEPPRGLGHVVLLRVLVIAAVLAGATVTIAVRSRILKEGHDEGAHHEGRGQAAAYHGECPGHGHDDGQRLVRRCGAHLEHEEEGDPLRQADLQHGHAHHEGAQVEHRDLVPVRRDDVVRTGDPAHGDEHHRNQGGHVDRHHLEHPEAGA